MFRKKTKEEPQKPRWLKEVVRLGLEPNDVLILQPEQRLSVSEIEHLRIQLKPFIENPIVVLRGDIEVGAIGEAVHREEC